MIPVTCKHKQNVVCSLHRENFLNCSIFFSLALIASDLTRIPYSKLYSRAHLVFEPRCEKTGLRGFRPGPTQTGLYSHKRWLEA